jgi:nucleoside-diphosphate-sugar epimerase
MGPTLIPGGFTSANFVVRYFNGSMTELNPSAIGYVDVRDVSRLHLEALRRPEAANQRFIAYSERLYMKEVGDILAAEFIPKGYTITTNEKSGERERDTRVSNLKSRTTFGIEFISGKDALIAMAYSLIEHGVIKRAE